MLRAVSPVPPSLALEFAGGRTLMRRAAVHQVRIGQSIAFLDGDEPAALAMMDCRRAGRAEICLIFGPAARRNMLELARIAQLTLASLAENRILGFARVRPGHAPGERMARLAGMRPGGFRDRSIWIYGRR